MSKLTDRLRHAALADPNDEREPVCADLLREAADEIERLFAEQYNYPTRIDDLDEERGALALKLETYRRAINRAGGLALQGASQELIRQVLAEAIDAEEHGKCVCDGDQDEHDPGCPLRADVQEQDLCGECEYPVGSGTPGCATCARFVERREPPETAICNVCRLQSELSTMVCEECYIEHGMESVEWGQRHP